MHRGVREGRGEEVGERDRQGREEGEWTEMERWFGDEMRRGEGGCWRKEGRRKKEVIGKR